MSAKVSPEISTSHFSQAKAAQAETLSCESAATDLCLCYPEWRFPLPWFALESQAGGRC